MPDLSRRETADLPQVTSPLLVCIKSAHGAAAFRGVKEGVNHPGSSLEHTAWRQRSLFSITPWLQWARLRRHSEIYQVRPFLLPPDPDFFRFRTENPKPPIFLPKVKYWPWA